MREGHDKGSEWPRCSVSLRFLVINLKEDLSAESFRFSMSILRILSTEE